MGIPVSVKRGKKCPFTKTTNQNPARPVSLKKAEVGAVISDFDLVNLQSLYPYAGLDDGFTAQQEQFILQYMRGLKPAAAARAAGYEASYGSVLLGQEKIQRAIDLLRDQKFTDVRVTRDILNSMLFEAHAKSATATEEIFAIKELGKMNGLYESDKQRGAGVQINIGSQVLNHKQIERMGDQQLLEIAGLDTPITIDDFEVLDDSS